VSFIMELINLKPYREHSLTVKQVMFVYGVEGIQDIAVIAIQIFVTALSKNSFVYVSWLYCSNGKLKPTFLRWLRIG
jgi:hypothetical protein